jgi:hypothetical protein
VSDTSQQVFPYGGFETTGKWWVFAWHHYDEYRLEWNEADELHDTQERAVEFALELGKSPDGVGYTLWVVAPDGSARALCELVT